MPKRKAKPGSGGDKRATGVLIKGITKNSRESQYTNKYPKVKSIGTSYSLPELRPTELDASDRIVFDIIVPSHLYLRYKVAASISKQ